MTKTAKKAEPGMATLIVVLVVISAIVAFGLGLIDMVTAPQIALNEEKEKQEAMEAVLPTESYEEVPYTPEDGSIVNNIYRAGDEGWVIQVSPNGFSGAVVTMVGVTKEGTVSGVSIVSHAETSGLGANATKTSFRDQFIGKSGVVTVNKDGGEIDALTGATITSRAVASGVTAALEAAASLS